VSEPPSDLELGAWRALLRAHAGVARQLESDLVAGHGLSLADFDVLDRLRAAPGGRLRMSELAAAVLLSRSGLTRLVDRLQREGLVCRQSCTSDARGTYTVVTETGLRRLRGASRTHLTAVRIQVGGRLSLTELAELHRLLSRLAADEARLAAPAAG
jgi:DNA-binding MarR family transcriptional regulator